MHFVDGGPLTLQYLLVLDTLNFCFWPDGELEYEHLAGGLKVLMPAVLSTLVILCHVRVGVVLHAHGRWVH
jgi:hypothetical protein